MKSLNWHQAAALAVDQQRAIRREGWQHWIYYRFNVWIRSEIGADGMEKRKVVRAHQFTDSEFMAKDWTEEPWPGGTTPPCTTLPPASVVPETGQGAWTLDALLCGGNGEGGGVSPDTLDELRPPGGQDDGYGGNGGGGGPAPDNPGQQVNIQLKLEAWEATEETSVYIQNYMHPSIGVPRTVIRSPGPTLATDGEGCWTESAEERNAAIRIRADITPPGWSHIDSQNAHRAYLWATTNPEIDLSIEGPPFLKPELAGPGTDNMPVIEGAQLCRSYCPLLYSPDSGWPVTGFIGTMFLSAIVPIVPGADAFFYRLTWVSDSGNRITKYGKYTFAPACE